MSHCFQLHARFSGVIPWNVFPLLTLPVPDPPVLPLPLFDLVSSCSPTWFCLSYLLNFIDSMVYCKLDCLSGLLIWTYFFFLLWINWEIVEELDESLHVI